jgi:hypothetical protein
MPPPLAPFASRAIGLPAVGRQARAPLHFASRITAPGARVMAFLFNTNEALPKKLTCSKQSRKHFLFDTFGRFFLAPAVDLVASTFTRPNAPARTLRMLLIDVPAIRNVRNSQKTINGDQF